MHRILFILMSLALFLSACGGDDTKDENNSSNNADNANNANNANNSNNKTPKGFCCDADAYYECPQEISSYSCGDTSQCTAKAEKNRICSGSATAQSIGATCTDSFECKGGACRIRQSGNYCTVTCNGDNDCPLGWSCYGNNNKICIKPNEQ